MWSVMLVMTDSNLCVSIVSRLESGEEDGGEDCLDASSKAANRFVTAS